MRHKTSAAPRLKVLKAFVGPACAGNLAREQCPVNLAPQLARPALTATIPELDQVTLLTLLLPSPFLWPQAAPSASELVWSRFALALASGLCLGLWLWLSL